MHLVAGCVMEGSVVLCQKNILEHSMRFHGDYLKGCLLTLLVSQSYRVMRNQPSNMQSQSSFNCAILPIYQKQCKLIVNNNLLFHFPWFIYVSTFSNFFIRYASLHILPNVEAYIIFEVKQFCYYFCIIQVIRGYYKRISNVLIFNRAE
jgi:hypothetical protein